MKNSQLSQAWRDRFAAYSISGLSVTEFCRVSSLEVRSYYYWKRRIAKLEDTHCDVSSKPSVLTTSTAWVSLAPSKAGKSVSTPQSHTLIVKISGAEIEVDASFNASLLRAVVCALGQQPC